MNFKKRVGFAAVSVLFIVAYFIFKQAGYLYKKVVPKEELIVEVYGHTDLVGSVEFERLKRLEAVERVLGRLENLENLESLLAERFNEELFADRFIKELPTAFVTYNRLIELWYQKTETLLFVVDLRSTRSRRLPLALKGESTNVELPVTPHMSVELTGSAGLDIEPKGRVKKRVSDAASTSWNWKINPIGTGEQFLMLTTYVHMSENVGSEPHGTEVYTDSITINVKPWDRLTIAISAFQPVWVFTGIVIAALAGAYRWIRRRGWRADRKPYVSTIQGIRRDNKKNRSE